MKQLNLLKTLFLLCALMVGSSSVWADTSTLTFTAACGGSGTADDGAEWTVTSDGSESSFDNTKGIHYGTNSAQVTYIQLSTNDISGTITSIVVNASTANSVSASVSVTVGGDAFGGDAQSLTTSAADYTFNGSASGEIVVRVAKPSKAVKAIYVKSVTVTYSNGAVVNVTGVELNKSSLTLTAGEKETLTATVSPDNATNKSVNWTSDDESVATVAAGVVTAVAAGTCTITVTTVDGAKTATCDVTVNAAPILPIAATFDFTDTGWGFPADYTITEGSYTNGGYTIMLGAVTTGGHKALTSGTGSSKKQTALLFGKEEGASLTFPAFDFNVSKIKVYGASGASGRVTFNVYVGDDAVSTEATSSAVDHEFEITAAKQAAGTVYMIKLTNANNCQISKIEVFGYDEKEVTAAGYATYVTKHNVQFEEGDAYAVTIEGGVAKLTPVTQVRKNVPVLLKGTGVKKPAVLEEAPDAITTDLKVSNGGDPGDNAYVLANKSKGVGFYLWKSGTSLTSGKVYLKADASAHELEFIGFDEENSETTGISEIEKLRNGGNETFFNLAGQRVAQPTKGLYIVNGKKVIIK